MAAPRTFVVGDIHGCLRPLEALLDRLPITAGDELVFLGDYIDRGPQSRGVIDRLLRLRKEHARCVFLRGNHEDMFLDYLGLGGRHGGSFLLNGGAATLQAYGREPEEDPAGVASRLPAEHVAFLQELAFSHQAPGLVCVHAGLRPGVALEEQSDEDLLWIREPWTEWRHPWEFTVVYGHTARKAVQVDLPWKLGIDTGAVYGNLLTAVEAGAWRLYQAPSRGGPVQVHDLLLPQA